MTNSDAVGFALAEHGTATITRDAATGRFRGVCACGQTLGAEWHHPESPVLEWETHLKGVRQAATPQ